MAKKTVFHHFVRGYEAVADGIFLLITLILSLIPVALTVAAVWSILTPVFAGEPVLHALLRGIGYLIVAVAVFDVAKFLFEEEIIRGSELRSSTEARQSLTKFMTIMIIAFSLEALVIVFEAQEGENVELIEPILLFAVAVFGMIGLSLFQYLSRQSEERDPPVRDNIETVQQPDD